MDDDAALFAWLRHYGAVILLFAALGGLAGFVYTHVVPRRADAWTLVVETGTSIQPRQLGAVSQAIFDSVEVYRPAMQRLGIQKSPMDFLANDVALQPVPNTNTLVIVGKGRTLVEAARVSRVTATAFVDALRSQGPVSRFDIFGETQPAPVREGISTPVAIVVMAIAALWIGLVVAVGHYRYRRPVLAIEPAIALTGADAAVAVRGRIPGWLGALQGRAAWRLLDGRSPVLRDVTEQRPKAVLIAPGAPTSVQGNLARRWGYDADIGTDLSFNGDAFTEWHARFRSATYPVILLCRPSTSQRELRAIGETRRSVAPASRVQLVWIR